MLGKKILSALVAGVMMLGIGISVPNDVLQKNITPIVAEASTPNQLSISENGLQFIIELEGFSSTCFWDYAQWTIGYGTKCTGTGHPSNPSNLQKGSHTITKAAAKERFLTVIHDTYEPGVRKYLSGLNMTQNQYDALVSLCYNAGAGRLSDSPLAKYLRGELSKDAAYNAYLSYVITAGGVVNSGLKNRRRKEADLFFSGVSEPVNPPTYSILTANKSMITINEEITFTASSDYATNFTIGVDNADGRYATKEMVGNSITMKFDKAGSYGAYVTSYNSKGYCDSAWINFMVYNEKPSASYLTANKSAVAVGEEIIFTATSDEKVKGFTIGVCKGENRVITQDLTDGKISLSFNEQGNYGAYVTAWNDIGYFDSSWINFIVYDSKPNVSVLFVERNIVEVGEPVVFSATSDVASGFCVGVDSETERVLTEDMENSQLRCTFDKPGNYSAYVTAFNSMGYCDSTRVYFTIVDSKPTVSELSSSSNKALVGEEITFYASSDVATAFWAGIDYNGERYKTEEMVNGQLTCSFSKPGRYTAYVTSLNKFGYVDSKIIVFNIYSDENEMIYNGDCNNDGELTIFDAAMLQKYLLNMTNLTDNTAADLNGDGIVNVFDLAMMKRMLLQK